jgi:PAS domain S-box-containing protein
MFMNFKLPQSLRFRLLLVMGAAFLPLALALVLNGLQHRQAATEAAETSLRQAVIEAGDRYSKQIADARRILTLISAMPAVESGMVERCNQALVSVLATTPQFQNISLMAASGAPICSAQELPSSISIANRPYFQQALASGEFTISSVVASRVTGLPAIATALPIQNAAGRIDSVLVAGFDLNWLEATLSATLLPAGSRIALLDNTGRLLASAPEAGAPSGLALNAQVIERILASHEPGTTQTIGMEGADILLSYAPIGEGQPAPLHVVVTTPTTAVYSGAQETFLRTLGAFALFLLVAALLLISGLSNLILKPMSAMTVAARRIAAGERGVRSGLDRQADEIGVLAAAFDRMADTLETQARELEERSRSAESQARLLERSQSIAQIGGWEIDLRTGKLFWTAEVYRILEVPLGEATPALDEALSYYPPESRERLEHMIAHAQQTGEGWDMELEVITRNGRLRQVRVAGTILSHEGVPLTAYGAMQDISVLKERETRLSMALNAGQMGIWVYDLEHQQLLWSEETIHMFGLELHEFDNSPDMYFRFVHPEDRPKLQQIQADFINHRTNHSVYHHEHRIIRPDGSIRWIQGRGQIVRYPSGQAHTFHGIVIDITERKKAEEEQQRLEAQMQRTQKLESLGVLAGGIAHDFNNLLVSMIGYADLSLLELDDGDPLHGNLEAIIRSGENAAELCRQLLAYAGKGQLNMQPVQLSHLVSEMVHLIQVSISKKIELELELSENLPAIKAEPGQLRQIILNLVINASEAIEDNRGRIVVRTAMTYSDQQYLQNTLLANDLTPGDYVLLEVTDNGKGMNAETCQRIFDPFFSTKVQGRGLGLAAVLGIINSHCGAISVESEPDTGTSFRVLFPPNTASELKTCRLPGKRSELRINGGVLLIDDEAEVRKVLERMLQSLGLKLFSAADGVAGLELYDQQANEIALVLLDMTMPRMDGAEAFYELRRRNLDLPIIFMSGYSEQTRIVDPAGRGPDGFLAKPFREHELLAQLQAVAMVMG